MKNDWLTEETERWNKMTVDDRIAELQNYCDYVDYEYIARCKTISDLEQLYMFVTMEVGVEFVSGVYETIDEELEDGPVSETQKLVGAFNDRVGYEII